MFRSNAYLKLGHSLSDISTCFMWILCARDIWWVFASCSGFVSETDMFDWLGRRWWTFRIRSTLKYISHAYATINRGTSPLGSRYHVEWKIIHTVLWQRASETRLWSIFLTQTANPSYTKDARFVTCFVRFHPSPSTATQTATARMYIGPTMCWNIFVLFLECVGEERRSRMKQRGKIDLTPFNFPKGKWWMIENAS